MKRDAPNNSKMKRLCRVLDIPLYHGAGILELLWHLTARESPRGDIGKLDNESIALALDYRGDEDRLIDALTRTGWLDEDGDYRLVVHDWNEHADEAVKKRLTRSGQSFILSRRVETKQSSVSTKRQNGSLPRAGAKPEPEPEPEPEPDGGDIPAPLTPTESSGKLDPHEAIYREYPRKVGKDAALKSISRAIKRLTKDRTTREAQVYLFHRTQTYARSPAGNDGEFTPHPTTWFNQGRYNDDTSEWERTHDGTNSSRTDSNPARAGAAGRVERTLTASREAAARRRGAGPVQHADGADVGLLPAPGVSSGDG